MVRLRRQRSFTQVASPESSILVSRSTSHVTSRIAADSTSATWVSSPNDAPTVGCIPFALRSAKPAVDAGRAAGIGDSRYLSTMENLSPPTHHGVIQFR